MRRLLMFLYLLLVMSEAKPRSGWKRLIPRRRYATPKSLMESGVFDLPLTATTRRITARHQESAAEPSGPTSPAIVKVPEVGEPKHKAVVEVIPPSLVEVEEKCAVILQIPAKTPPTWSRRFGNEPYNSPIGRTLTREFVRRDPTHVPRAALRHLPLDDVARELAHGRSVGSQPTSPRSAATLPKGRPTPKRPRRNHG